MSKRTFSPRIPSKKGPRSVRLVTFNVNGVKTLFNYHPWNEHEQKFDTLFKYLDADIVSLQELKLTPQNISSTKIGNTNLYRTFISVPKTKKGYSGVALFVRIPTEDDYAILEHLTVIKAEEGITGYLLSPDEKGVRYRDLAPGRSIGCYPMDVDEDTCLKLDSEGRCIAVQLASGLIIFSVYCPANSSGTDEGERQRLEFLRLLLKRCKDLHDHGNVVIIMGDINVALDLIDHADYMRESFKQGIIKPLNDASNDGTELERVNTEACINFKSSTPARSLLNSYVHWSSPFLQPSESGEHFLFDTTRAVQSRRLGMYSVWNTLTGARQSNFGSRIDLILSSSKNMYENVSAADIWPFLYGSDHCPAFTDFEMEPLHRKQTKQMPLKLEAKNFFRLVQHRDIAQMFKSRSRPVSEPIDENDGQVEFKRQKVVYKSRKKAADNTQKSIGQFYFSDVQKKPEAMVEIKDQEPTENNARTDLRRLVSTMYGDVPRCKHGDLAELKTSLKNLKTRGKKFWTCAKANSMIQGSLPNEDCKCDFFAWAEPRKN